MKTITRMLPLLLAAFGLFVALPATASAQEWSAAQKEVWKNVEAYWAADAAGNTDEFMGYFHSDYSGWGTRMGAPGSKEMAKKFISHGHKAGKTLVYHVQPVAIKIHGDVAIVHYYFMQITQATGEKEKESSGRWTDILMKQGDKWVLIGDNGGVTSKE
ncbi:MAG: nuclear transport factor 2 family protein [Opitutus sp.]